jgi:hypothetical protein
MTDSEYWALTPEQRIPIDDLADMLVRFAIERVQGQVEQKQEEVA